MEKGKTRTSQSFYLEHVVGIIFTRRIVLSIYNDNTNKIINISGFFLFNGFQIFYLADADESIS
jgi:hypothetical protein